MPKRTPAQKDADKKVTQEKIQKKNKRRAKWERFGWAVQGRVERVAEITYGLTTGEGQQCAAIKPDGKRCQSAAMTGGTYCRSHIGK